MMSLQVTDSHSAASASPRPSREAGKAGTARCFDIYTLPTNHGVCEDTGSILLGDSRNPQHSLDLLTRPGQRAEIICSHSLFSHS